MIIFEHILFGIKICSLQKKVQKKMLEKPICFSKDFLTPFLFGKADTRKKRSEKEEKRDNTTIEKIKRTLKKRKEFLLKIKMEQKSRGDKRSFVFLHENIFSNEIFFIKTFER